jgi:two-component sensor histidine kinase
MRALAYLQEWESPWKRYCFAVCAFAATLLLRFALNPLMAGDAGFILFVPATMIVAFISGVTVSAVVAAVTGLAIWYFFVPAYWSFAIEPSGVVVLATYAVVTIITLLLVHEIRLLIARLEAEKKKSDQLAARQERTSTAMLAVVQASERLWRTTNLESGLREILLGAISVLSADKGNVQLLDPAGKVLTIAAQSGFEKPFLDRFRSVSADDDTACGRCLRGGHRIVIPDIEAEPSFAPFLSVAREAGYRSVQSTPLITPQCALLGIISTHWAKAHTPDPYGLALLDLYVQQAVTFIERVHQEEKVVLLNREIAHRFKNLLSVVSGIAHRTIPSGMADAFHARLLSLAASHDILVRQNFKGATINDLVRSQMDHALGVARERIRAEGPPIVLPPDAAQSVGMALHELVTNAGKYGALSRKDGEVSLVWTCQSASPGSSRIGIRWIERGAPPVAQPIKTGFGTLVLGRLTEQALGAKVEMGFKPEGFFWSVDWDQPDRHA